MQDIYDLFDSNNTGEKYGVLPIADYALSYIENKGFLCTGDTLHGLMYFLQLIYIDTYNKDLFDATFLTTSSGIIVYEIKSVYPFYRTLITLNKNRITKLEKDRYKETNIGKKEKAFIKDVVDYVLYFHKYELKHDLTTTIVNQTPYRQAFNRLPFRPNSGVITSYDMLDFLQSA